MGKNNKGKKRGDQVGFNSVVSHGPSAAALDFDLPPPAVIQELSPEPKPIRLNEGFGTGHGIQFPNAVTPNLPQHDVGWGSQGRHNDWAEQEQDGFDDEGTAAGADDNWGTEPHDAADGWGSGSRTRTSPSGHTSPPSRHPGSAHGGGQGVPAQGLAAALAGLSSTGRFGARPEPAPAPLSGEPVLKKKSTLKNSSAAAQASRAVVDPPGLATPGTQQQLKRVAFGGSSLRPPADPTFDAPSPPPPGPSNLAFPGIPGQSNHQMPSRSHAHDPWGAPATFPEPQNHAGPSPWGLPIQQLPQHTTPAPSAPPINTRSMSMPALPAQGKPQPQNQAWMQWGNEAAKKYAMAQQAAAAHLPRAAAPAAQAPPASGPPPPGPPAGGPPIAQLQQLLAIRQAQLRAREAQTGAAMGRAGSFPAPALPAQQPINIRSPANGPATPSATWQHLREKGHLPQTPHTRQREAAMPRQPPPRMETADSWGQDWNQGGRFREEDEDEEEYDEDDEDEEEEGEWGGGGNAHNGGGWGAAANDPWSNPNAKHAVPGGNQWGSPKVQGWGGGGGDPYGASMGRKPEAGGWGDVQAGQGEHKLHHSHGKLGRENSKGHKPKADAGWGAPGGAAWGDPPRAGAVSPAAGNGGWDAVGGGGGVGLEGGWGTGGWDAGGGGGGGRGEGSGGGAGGGWDAGAGAGGELGGWGNIANDHGHGSRNDKKDKSHRRGESGHGRNPSSTGHGGWDEWEVIPEEGEEDEDDEDEYEDDLESMYTEPQRADQGMNGRHAGQGRRNSHISPRISYSLQSATGRLAAAGNGPLPPTPHPFASLGLGLGTPSPRAQRPVRSQSLPTLPDPNVSQTMNFATGRMHNVFTLPAPKPPNSGPSHIYTAQDRDVLRSARVALYGRPRLARDRIHWAFNPNKDPRVASLIRWVEAMSTDLAVFGLQKFIQTGQRGALITSAEIQHTSAPGVIEPVFDWITLQDARPTWDRVLQESIICYNPEKQVVVFAFLLSKSGNSMAMWRRKCPIPDAVRNVNKHIIHQTIMKLDEEEVVYVDELHEKPPPPPATSGTLARGPKGEKRSWWRRLFGFLFRSKKSKESNKLRKAN